MKQTETALLEILCAVLREAAPSDPGLSPEQWEELFALCEQHKLLPLILDAVWALPSCRAALRADRQKDAGDPAAPKPSEARGRWRELALGQVSRQALQENAFLNLMLSLRERGLEALVLKGPVCRALYPRPLLRPSVDDDLLIPDDRAPAFHAALLELGMSADDPKADPVKAWELSYHKPDSPLYLELHKRLFDPGSPVLADFNAPFAGVMDRAVSVTVQDVNLKTPAPTDHLLFLLLHAFKHFLFSGFGLRIVTDICLYSRQYGPQIDFDRVRSVCEGLRCHLFAAAVYRIGEHYLGLPIPEPFASIDVEEGELLRDVLDSGLHGAEIDRLHSANITLEAVAKARSGKAASGGLRSSLFPAAGKLRASYPFLERRPWLLPAAWGLRLLSYRKNNRRYGKQSPAATLRIGRERVRLLKTYGVIDE